jgi:hypothetical protein
MKVGTLDIWLGVDIRDLAEAHLRAAHLRDAPTQHHLGA